MTHSGTHTRNAKPISVARPAAKVEELVESPFLEDLVVAAGHGQLNEDLALAMLKRRDLSVSVLEALIRNHGVMKHRKVLVKVAQHPRTPRHISLPLLRRLFVFELMHVALEPAVATDLKLLAEEVLVDKLETLSLGECINLARRASTGVAGRLLLHDEPPVIEAALQNSRMTEASIVKSLGKNDVPAALLSMLAEHPKWSLRREIQIAMIRRPEATETVVLKVVSKLPKPAILVVLKQIKLPEGRGAILRSVLAQR